MKQRCSAWVSLFALIAGYGAAAVGQSGSVDGVRRSEALPQLPRPTGSFGIGRIGYRWVDNSRQDQFSADRTAHRELMVYFWYPTSKGPLNVRGTYLPGAQRMDAIPEAQTRLRREFGANWPAMLSGAIFSHALEGAKLAKNTRRFPVVVFSHGLGSTGFNYTILIEHLVSHGYVVASIEHTYIALAVWFPDGRVFLRHAESQGETITEGAADVRFVLNRLTEADHPQQFLLAGRLDLNRIAAMGHSAGAEFAARAGQIEERFKACVDLDGEMPPIAALPDYGDGATLKQPLFFLAAYHPESQMAGTPAEHAEYFKKKEEQLQASRPGSYEVILRSPGIAHPSFTDIPLLFAGHDGYPETNAVLHNLELIEGYTREFLGKNLKQEKTPRLDKGTTAEATVQHLGR